MCGANTEQNALIIGTGGLAAPFVMQRNAQKQAERQQSDAIAKQDAAQKRAQDQAAEIGPAAKAVDLTQDSKTYDSLKRNRVAMQNGILGTVKTSSLNATPAAAVAKTTLGS